ncbi:DUF6302 family protein [Streptomyces uncialis]|uniref:helix-turn-helix transcriptional regulator n=1 Tax=Streptomyces uncialis TaxID=1048205 RepID=UPI00365C3A96
MRTGALIHPATPVLTGPDRLTAEVRRTLAATAAGLGTQHIADRDRIPHTLVLDHLATACEVLGAQRLPELVVAACLGGVLPVPATAGDTVMVTEQEETVLLLTLDGLDTRTIADRLGTTYTTVHTRRQALMARLGAHTPAHLVSRAWESGLLAWRPGTGFMPQTGLRREAEVLRTRLCDPGLLNRALVVRVADGPSGIGVYRPAVPVGGRRTAGFLRVDVLSLPGVLRRMQNLPEDAGFPRAREVLTQREPDSFMIRWGGWMPPRCESAAAGRRLGYHQAGAAEYAAERTAPTASARQGESRLEAVR